jgi:hypothetical protein
MPAMQPPTGPINIADPNNVPELFVNGLFNIMYMGGMVQITFTTMRPNANDLFGGKDAPEFRGTVACRPLMPSGLAEQLVQRSRTVSSRLPSHRDRRRLPEPRTSPSLATGKILAPLFAARYDSSERLVRRRNRQPRGPPLLLQGREVDQGQQRSTGCSMPATISTKLRRCSPSRSSIGPRVRTSAISVLLPPASDSSDVRRARFGVSFHGLANSVEQLEEVLCSARRAIVSSNALSLTPSTVKYASARFVNPIILSFHS